MLHRVPLVCLLLALVLSGCRGDEYCPGEASCDSDVSTTDSAPDSDTDTDNDSGESDDLAIGTPFGGYLNCNQLDPAKVYLFGTIGLDTNQRALGDPLDPYRFCVSGISRYGAISSAGKYLHEITVVETNTQTDGSITNTIVGNAIAEFEQDSLFVSDGAWVYDPPDYDPTENDIQLYLMNENALTASRVITNPSNSSDLVYLYFDDIYSPEGVLLYTINNGSPTALAMLSDGTVLVGESGVLKGVSRAGVVTTISLPDGMSTNWQDVGKHHAGGIWILTGAFQNERWNLKLDLTLEFNGTYADVPDEVEANIPWSQAIDGDGNLWELYFDTGNTGLIVKRPLSAEGASEIVYRSSNGPGNEDWTTNPTPYIYPFLDSSLVTGP